MTTITSVSACNHGFRQVYMYKPNSHNNYTSLKAWTASTLRAYVTGLGSQLTMVSAHWNLWLALDICCKVKVPRQDLDKHIQSSMFQHMTDMALSHTATKTQLTALKQEHEALKEDHTSLKKDHAAFCREKTEPK